MRIANHRAAWIREPRVLAAAGLCLLAFLGNRVVTWILNVVGMSQFHRQASFVLHVVGTVAFVYGAMLIFEAYGAARRARSEAVEPVDRSLEP
ncbi:MAG: hypothetical protein JOZ99_00700 [Actinobacteria bacterium]|nr:hypothetical protein [Actinomycetota bacterium]